MGFAAMKLCSRRLDDARVMLKAFDSVGVSLFTLIGSDEDNTIFLVRKFCDYETLYLNLCSDLLEAERNHYSLHLRPYSISGNIAQLDDLNIFSSCVCGLLKPFLITETSRQNYQMWIAFDDKIIIDELKAVKKLFNADPGSTGSCQLGGSINFKEKHGPDFPTVRVVYSSLGTVTSKTMVLESIDNYTTDTRRKSPLPGCSPSAPGTGYGTRKSWPFYNKALSMAPLKHDKSGVDRSVADLNWCCMALKFGFEVDEVAEKLFHLSTKAQEKGYPLGEAYAINTAYRALDFVSRKFA